METLTGIGAHTFLEEVSGNYGIERSSWQVQEARVLGGVELSVRFYLEEVSHWG